MTTNERVSRLLDFYFVVSCTSNGKEVIKSRLKNVSLADTKDSKPKFAKFALKPVIIDRYPSISHKNTPLLPWVARIAMPRGVRARTRPPYPRIGHFVGWNIDGSKLYGIYLEIYEKIDLKVCLIFSMFVFLEKN